MMPQKKNPDVFELLRAHASRSIGDLTALLATVKGLPSGYMRDLQETQPPLFAAADRGQDALGVLKVAMPAVRTRPHAGEQALSSGFSQATDLAERAVARGMAFRDAYRAVGALIRSRLDADKQLSGVTLSDAQAFVPVLEADDLAVLDPRVAVRAKESTGGTGPKAVATQVEALRLEADAARKRASKVRSIEAMVESLRGETL